jgi:hypothetical protein
VVEYTFIKADMIIPVSRSELAESVGLVLDIEGKKVFLDIQDEPAKVTGLVLPAGHGTKAKTNGTKKRNGVRAKGSNGLPKATKESKILGAKITKAWEDSGMTQEEFAKKGGVSASWMWKMRSGQVRTINAQYRKACRKWGITLPNKMQGPNDYPF